MLVPNAASVNIASHCLAYCSCDCEIMVISACFGAGEEFVALSGVALGDSR